MYGYGMWPSPMGYPMVGAGCGVDVNGDGITDYRVKPGVGVDVNGDGISDFRTGPRIQPGPGMYIGGMVPGMGMGYGGYGY